MVKCTDCKKFYYDRDDYPVCGAYNVMVSWDEKDEQYPCEKPGWGKKFVPKNGDKNEA